MIIQIAPPPELRQYGAKTTIAFRLQRTGEERICPCSGDVRIKKDRGDWRNAINYLVDRDASGVFTLVLTKNEMQAAQITIMIADQYKTKKTWHDKMVVIETFGHAASQYPGGLNL